MAASWWRGVGQLVRIVEAPAERPAWTRFEEFGLRVFSDVVSGAEEAAIVAELDGRLRKLDYLPSHWDEVITGYREFQLGDFDDEAARHPTTVALLRALKSRYFRRAADMPDDGLAPGHWPPARDEPSLGAHVLDYKPDGFVRAHVDSVEFAGDLLLGLSLISPVVMRFVMKPPPALSDTAQQVVVDAVIPPRSVYYMSLASRYEATHQTFPPDDPTPVVQYGLPAARGRRIAVILRSPPPGDSK